ncbi:hypothetical protein [Ralstonia chuxiongensis]|uniref:Uncharacterized protein n=1 Tax=Ralstonia chuxiongensis TaxID=2957504 RepID=A0AA41WYA8_9RALS|nr:hypothetical protein [Ralstonia chuxiongensis]MCP1173765.1 hypothetical protein [Ralstonia chuxiongensis]
MHDYTVYLIAKNPQQRPKAVTIYRIAAPSRLDAERQALSLMADDELWEVNAVVLAA